jgi:D-glycerate 3-kinase
MSDEALIRFIQHYERVTRWMDVEMPARADAVIALEADRSLRDLAFKEPKPAPPPPL